MTAHTTARPRTGNGNGRRRLRMHHSTSSHSKLTASSLLNNYRTAWINNREEVTVREQRESAVAPRWPDSNGPPCWRPLRTNEREGEREQRTREGKEKMVGTKAGGFEKSRVSGMMTNAPFILNVDCDMFANNPQVVLHAMCLLLGSKNERDCSFVQFPQKFYDGLKDDPFGNQLIVPQYFFSRGATGIQGPLYGGTGCFHRRKVIYGLSPNESQIYGKKLIDEKLKKQFGKSLRFCETVASILSESRYKADSFPSLSSTIAATIHVASCSFEYNSGWGKEVGWMYGSATEDVLTGLKIHSKGWKSMYLDPNPATFLGSAPTSGSAVLTQYKRWATGFMELMFSNCSPLKATLTEKLEFRSCLFYLWVMTWALCSIPELCYAILPAYCIINNSNFLPKVEDPAILIPVALFISYNVTGLWEFNHVGQSARAWWNNEKMRKTTSTSSWFFGFLAVILKLLGVSQTVFEITPKDQPEVFEGKKTGAGRFTFDESPIFIPDTTIVFLNLTSLAIFSLRLAQQQKHNVDGAGLGEVLCSVLAVLYLSPFLKGLFGKGKYGIPRSIMCKSVILMLLLVYLCMLNNFNF